MDGDGDGDGAARAGSKEVDGAARRAAPTGADDDLATIQRNAPSLLRVARRHSLCAHDAHDAYQRALEIYLRKRGSVRPEGLVGWLHTVVKHEAMSLRSARQRHVATADVDLDAHEASHLPSSEERVESFDRVARAAEALQRLKPQETSALLLKARGHSYAEICAVTGWTYTKVNRSLTEGRRSFLERYEGIESGAECERWADALSAIADGEASAAVLQAARPHLRNCPACRARVRDYRLAPGHAAAVLPVGVALAARPSSGTTPHLALRLYEGVAGALHERVALSAQKLQAALDAVASGKVVAVAASATALAGGGVVAVDRASDSGAPQQAVGRHLRVVAPARRRAAAVAPAGRPATRAAEASAQLHAPKSRDAGAATRSARSAGDFSFEQPAASAPRHRAARKAGIGRQLDGSGRGRRTVRASRADRGYAGREFGP